MNALKKVIAVFIFYSVFFSAYSLAQQINYDQAKTVDIVIKDLNSSLNDASKSKFVLDLHVNYDRNLNKSDFSKRFPVSVGLLIDNPTPGKEPELTPEGSFHPRRLIIDHVSGQFGGKILGIFETGAMPFSIFFYNGFAIHGSYSIVDGRPASKGCVRMSPSHAEEVYYWVFAAIQNNNNSNRSVNIHIQDTESDYVSRYRK